MTKTQRLEAALKGYKCYLKMVDEIASMQGFDKPLSQGKVKFVKRQVMLTKKALSKLNQSKEA